MLSLVAFLAVLGAFLLVLPRLRVTTSITHFMPDAADRRAATLLRSLAEGESARTIVLDLSGGDVAVLGETAHALVARLRASPGIARVRSGLDAADEAAIGELIASRPPTALLDAMDFEDAPATARLARLRERLASPLGPVVSRLAPRDPLGGALDALEALAGAEGSVASRDGILFDAEGRHAFVFVSTAESALDAAAQRAHLARIDEAFLAARSAPSVRLEKSGIARMTVASEHAIREDIERIGGISTVGILALFALLFGSVRLVGLGLVPLFVGSAIATVACHVVFGEVHGLTLAFGASLLGVGIDYAEHYFSHFALTPERGAAGVMREVWPGLWMGALTTVVGFAGLGITGFPGIREIAVFSAVAIGAALASTRWLLPPWMPGDYAPARVMASLSRVADRLIAFVARRGRGLLLVPVLLGLAVVPLVLRARFVDDVSQLVAFDPALVAEDARVRDRVAPVDPGRFAVVVAPTEEEALVRLERTTSALDGAQADGLLSGYTSLGALVRSRARQEASFVRAKARRADLEALLVREGFVVAGFQPFFDGLAADTPALLTLDDVRRSPLGAFVAPLAPRLAEGQAFVLPLRGVRDTAALAARLPDATLLDEPALLETTYRDVRRNTLRMLALGVGLIVVTLFARYRSARVVGAAMLPAVLGAAGAVALLGAAGEALNLLHLVALLLVLSMGVDYGIFVVEARAKPSEGASALVSVVTATATTLLSFGLLGMSGMPALRALGLTITLGLTLTTVLCPLSLVFAASPERAS